MESSQVTSILVLTLTLSMSVCYALPFNNPWLDRASSASSEGSEENYPPEQYYGPHDLNRIRQLVALKLLGQMPLSSFTSDKTASFKGKDMHQAPSKRLEFAIGGLDNMDHILSTLDRKGLKNSKTKAHQIYQKMLKNGYKGNHSLDKLAKLMENVG